MLLHVLTASAVISTVQIMLRDALPRRFREEASFIVPLHRPVYATSVFSSEQCCQQGRGMQHEGQAGRSEHMVSADLQPRERAQHHGGQNIWPVCLDRVLLSADAVLAGHG